MAQVGGVAAKKVMSLTQKFSVSIFFATQQSFLCFSMIGSDNVIVSNNKNIQQVISASEIAILSLPEHHNSTILATAY